MAGVIDSQTDEELAEAKRVFRAQYGVSTKVVERKISVLGTVPKVMDKRLQMMMREKELDVVAVQPWSRGYFAGFTCDDHLWTLVKTRNGDLFAYGRTHPVLEFSRSLPIDPEKKKVHSEGAVVQVLLDSSSNMAVKDCPGGKSRMRYCEEEISSLIRKRRYPVVWSLLGTLSGVGGFCIHDPGGEMILTMRTQNSNDTALRESIRETLGYSILQQDSGNMSPKCVVVLISGVPQSSGEELDKLKDEIRHGTKYLSRKDRLILVFVQVGDDKDSERKWWELAKAGFDGDVVAFRSFTEFKERGLEGIVEEFVQIERRTNKK